MFEGLSRIQLAVYAAIGIVLVLLGIRAVREESPAGSAQASSGTGLASRPVGGDGPSASNGDVIVHVAGAVAKPGVYRLPAGSRVADAIERAGGARGAADPDAINLAARLADGQQVVVPARGPVSAGAGTAATGEDGPISLGSADQAALEAIDGIGPVTAADIIEFRDESGGVSSIDELDQIPGIGPATIESLSGDLQP
jgi:competence protein ComEA